MRPAPPWDSGISRPGFEGALRALAVDRVTAEVVGAFDRAGISSILLKGPSIARWLYPTGGRTYRDTDLLVPGPDFTRAGVVLEDLGFVALMEGWAAAERPRHETATAYYRTGAAAPGVVDLHRSLPGLTVSEDVLWKALTARTDILRLASVSVRVLDRTALAFHIVLHAVQHRHDAHTSDDLRRLLGALPTSQWAEVAALAASVGASETLALGLSGELEGIEIAASLGLDTPAVEESSWWRMYAPRGAGSLARLAAERTLRGRMAQMRSALLPSPSKLRYVNGLAAAPPSALVKAYLTWWWGLARALPGAVRYFVRRSTASRR